MEYTYDITTDISAAKVDLERLQDEVSDAGIASTVEAINLNDQTLGIVFSGEISASEKTTLDALVLNHSGEPYPEEATAQLVEFATSAPNGEPLIAVHKPAGDSVTHVSHNFCDNTTWPATNDSEWGISPATGKNMKVYKAEVQFTHDMKLATMTTPGEFILEVMAGGQAADTKTFKSILDVFDLGNAHYSMESTVDGVPGVTTVVFDYEDAIMLYSAYGMEMRFRTKDNLPLGGGHVSVSLVAEEVDV